MPVPKEAKLTAAQVYKATKGKYLKRDSFIEPLLDAATEKALPFGVAMGYALLGQRRGSTVINSGLFTSLTCDWATPKALYEQLATEFGPFDMDPCPFGYDGLVSGLAMEWTGRVFLNPPYGRAIGGWIQKAYESSLEGAMVICLIPARTDTRWWHDYVMQAREIRFLRGRLHFNDGKGTAPFPSAVVIFGEVL